MSSISPVFRRLTVLPNQPSDLAIQVSERLNKDIPADAIDDLIKSADINVKNASPERIASIIDCVMTEMRGNRTRRALSR